MLVLFTVMAFSSLVIEVCEHLGNGHFPQLGRDSRFTYFLYVPQGNNQEMSVVFLWLQIIDDDDDDV